MVDYGINPEGLRLADPFVGRAAEMRAIETAISDPEVAGILVSGAAGVGKSRIAREALSAAASRGCQTRWTVGTSSARNIPLGAFSAWAPSGATQPVHLLQGVIGALTAAPAGAPLVLVIDDVHLLDDLSAFVVHQIVQRRAARVILTLRDDEPVRAAIQEIWGAGQFSRVVVPELSVDETTALVTGSLPGPVDSEAVQRLWRLTRGNVLYLRTILQQEVAEGRLVEHHGYWRWVDDPVLPASLVDMVGSRIGAMPGPISDVIDVLAVGEPIGLAALIEIADAAAVEEAETHGLIALDPAGGEIEVRLAHPLYGEVRRRYSPVSRLRRLRGLVATHLASAADRDDIRVVVRRAALSIESDLESDADLYVEAAQGAVALGDLQLADRLAEAALKAGAGAHCNLLRAHALSWLGRGEEAEAVLADLGTDQLTETERASLVFLRSSNMLWALGDAVRAKDLIDDASRTTSSHARNYLDAFHTVYAFAMDQPDTAQRPSGDIALDALPVVSAELAWVLAQTSADAGRTSEAVRVAEAGYTVAAGALDAPQMVFNIADAEVSARLLAGDLSEATDVAERVRNQAVDLPGAARLLGAAVAGRAALASGDLTTARTLLHQAADGLSVSYPTGWGYRYRIPLITALAMSGDPDRAAAMLAALDIVKRPFRSMDYELCLARAWVAASQGVVTEAVAELRAGAQRAAAAGRFAAEVLCLQVATQFGDHSGASRLRELQSIVEGQRVGLAARFAAALGAGEADELVSVSDEFERMGDRVAAIDAAAHACAVYRREGRRGSALGCSTRADALAAECGGADTPALRQVAEPLPLTSREREIAMLIGAGLSSPAIAERLTLSVRTVESHIFRAMKKTGTTSRDQLAALVLRRRTATDSSRTQ